MAVGCALGTRGTGQAEGRPSRPGSGSPIQHIPPAKQQSYKFLRLFKVVFNKTEIFVLKKINKAHICTLLIADHLIMKRRKLRFRVKGT